MISKLALIVLAIFMILILSNKSFTSNFEVKIFYRSLKNEECLLLFEESTFNWAQFLIT